MSSSESEQSQQAPPQAEAPQQPEAAAGGVGCVELGFWVLGLVGVALFFWGQRLAGGGLYFIYVCEMCWNKSCGYLSNVQSESSFLDYIASLQEASPVIEFHIQNYHNEQVVVEDSKGQRKYRYERVNTHRAKELFPLAGFSDETLSPDQTVAMFHLLHHKGVREDDPALHETVIHAEDREKKLILTCKFPLCFVPRDAATAAALDRFREDFYRRHTTDTHQDKKETHSLTCNHKSHAMVIMSSSGTRDTSKPCWMSRIWYVLSHLCLLGLPFRCYLYSNTQPVVWHVRKHFSILPASQWRSAPIHSRTARALPANMNQVHIEVADRFLQLPEREEEALLLDPEDLEEAAVPDYWQNRDLKDFSCMELTTDSSDAMHRMVQKLLDECFVAKATRDRGGALPRRLVCELVQRLEHGKLWARYAEKRRAIRQRTEEVTLVEDMPGSGRCKTSLALGPLNQRLDASVNELYLFHGSSPAGVLGIGQAGFDLAMAGATGTMFGRGAYFAEASSKCDEYASEDPSGLFAKKCALLLCRVVCGEMLYLERSEPHAELRHDYDGVLGDREKAVGSYREFVVFDEAQVYPEYVVIYRREF